MATLLKVIKEAVGENDPNIVLYCRAFVFFELTGDQLTDLLGHKSCKDIFEDALALAKEGDAELRRDFWLFMADFKDVLVAREIPDPPQVNDTHPYTAKDWRREAAFWAETHPDAYELLMSFAQQLKERERRFGINLLRERLRWEGVYEYGNDEYKFCNSLSPYLARMLIADDPDLDTYIECRKTKW